MRVEEETDAKEDLIFVGLLKCTASSREMTPNSCIRALVTSRACVARP
jgi:hypothetical protein